MSEHSPIKLEGRGVSVTRTGGGPLDDDGLRVDIHGAEETKTFKLISRDGPIRLSVDDDTFHFTTNESEDPTYANL